VPAKKKPKAATKKTKSPPKRVEVKDLEARPQADAKGGGRTTKIWIEAG
jgi:hypothetical protein